MNTITSSTIHIPVNAGFGVHVSKCSCRHFMAVAGQASKYFDNFSHISIRILIILCYLCWCVIMLRYVQGFNVALLPLCRFYSQISLPSCPTSLANSPWVPCNSPQYQHKLILLPCLHSVSTATSVREQIHEQEHQLHVINETQKILPLSYRRLLNDAIDLSVGKIFFNKRRKSVVLFDSHWLNNPFDLLE